MPSSCCSNCRTKYSVLNPEAGCSNCAFSFCRKCLPYRALLPHLANKPKANGTQVTKIFVGDSAQPAYVGVNPSSSTNWWGDGLPPPSLRSTLNHPQPPPRVLHELIKRQVTKNERNVNDTSDLEARFQKSREDDVPKNVLTLSEIEERLAALRGCDVELIRRPRCIFESAEKLQPRGDTVRELLKEARDLAEIEERHDPVRELEGRHKRLRDEGQGGHSSTNTAETIEEDGSSTPKKVLEVDTQSQRLSEVSTATAFSEATSKELEEINRLMEDAQKRVNASEVDEKRMDNEMKSLLAATRQKSLEVDKVSKEIGHFWDKRLDKMDISESDDESLDDETVKKIILEAEQAVDEVRSDQTSTGKSTSSNVHSSPSNRQSSPRKRVFLERSSGNEVNRCE
ncbi:hypothetical protein KIN20_032727 [Parelaphostrongylus tenuis]|uniref:Uncharacterized protein n=1 Tax=Parelaphostrongylus tenuis TaxID=148309 RepID=A0AAD5R6W0_PARTN|nr:hypothetical protein KIN20_032727 [Parelaphostrongylus tenuis]